MDMEQFNHKLIPPFSRGVYLVEQGRGDLWVMDGQTQFEYEHSTASELKNPRVNLTFRWISQHNKQASLSVLYLRVRKVMLSRPLVWKGGGNKMAMFWTMVLLVVIGVCFFWRQVTVVDGVRRCRESQCLPSPECREEVDPSRIR